MRAIIMAVQDGQFVESPWIKPVTVSSAGGFVEYEHGRVFVRQWLIAILCC